MSAKFSQNRKAIALLCVLLELLWIQMKTQEASTITTDFSKKSGYYVSYRRKMRLMFGVPSNADAGTLEMRLFCR